MMAKASIIAAKQAQTLDTMEARLTALEAKLDAVLAALEALRQTQTAEPKKGAK
jgi:hypothetical protein